MSGFRRAAKAWILRESPAPNDEFTNFEIASGAAGAKASRSNGKLSSKSYHMQSFKLIGFYSEENNAQLGKDGSNALLRIVFF